MASPAIPWLPPRALTVNRAALLGALSTGLCVGLGHTSLSEIQGRTRLYWVLVSTAAVAAGPLARLLRPKEPSTLDWLFGGLAFIPPAAVLLRYAMLLGPSPWVPAFIIAAFAWVPHLPFAQVFIGVTDLRPEAPDALDAGLDPLSQVACWVASAACLGLWVTHGVAQAVVLVLLGLWGAVAVGLLATDAARLRWLAAVRGKTVPRWAIVSAHEVAGEELAPMLHGRDAHPDDVLVYGEATGAGPYRADDGRIPRARLSVGGPRAGGQSPVAWRRWRASGALLALGLAVGGEVGWRSTRHPRAPEALLAQTRAQLTPEPVLRVEGASLWRENGPGWYRLRGVDARTQRVLSAAQIAAMASGSSELFRARLGVAMTNSALGEVVTQADGRLSSTEALRIRDPWREAGTVVFWVLRGAGGSPSTGPERLWRARLSVRTGTAVLEAPLRFEGP